MTINSREYESVSDAELLGKLIGARQSQKLYHGRLRPLFSEDVEPSATHRKCAIARELVLRSMRESLDVGTALTSADLVREYLRLALTDRQYEVFMVLFLDAQNRVISIDEMFRGTLTQTAVYPREVVKAALRHNAAATIFAHNHPSGMPNPSQADRSLTRSLTEALALVDVRVLDHFIVAGPAILSFAECGMI